MNTAQLMQAAKQRAEQYVAGGMENYHATLGFIKKKDGIQTDMLVSFERTCKVRGRECGQITIRAKYEDGRAMAYIWECQGTKDCRQCNAPVAHAIWDVVSILEDRP